MDLSARGNAACIGCRFEKKSEGEAIGNVTDAEEQGLEGLKGAEGLRGERVGVHKGVENEGVGGRVEREEDESEGGEGGGMDSVVSEQFAGDERVAIVGGLEGRGVELLDVGQSYAAAVGLEEGDDEFESDAPAAAAAAPRALAFCLLRHFVATTDCMYFCLMHAS